MVSYIYQLQEMGFADLSSFTGMRFSRRIINDRFFISNIYYMDLSHLNTLTNSATFEGLVICHSREFLEETIIKNKYIIESEPSSRTNQDF